jgi:hypothetical protein
VPFLRQRLARARRRLGQEAGQLQALRLAAAERGHRLAQAHVVQAHVDDGLQPRDHLAVVRWNQCTASLTVSSSTSATLSCIGAAHELHVQQLGAVARPSQSGQRR